MVTGFDILLLWNFTYLVIEVIGKILIAYFFVLCFCWVMNLALQLGGAGYK